MANQVMQNGAVSGDRHVTASRWANYGGVSEHGLQRAGLVSAASTLMLARESAQTWQGIGDGPPAAEFNMALPPVISFPGSPRDPSVLV